MAGDWIPYFKGLPERMEVRQLAARTGRSVAEVVLAMLRFWSWVDAETTDGLLAPEIDSRTLSGLIPDTSPDFWGHVSAVGWLAQDDGGRLHVPNFDDWMGPTAKERLRDARRKRRKRMLDALAAARAGQMSGCEPDRCRPETGLHNRTDTEKKNTPLPPLPGGEEAAAVSANEVVQESTPPPERLAPALLAAWAAHRGLEPCRKLSERRLKHLRARAGDADWLAHWRGALARAARSRFCTGCNDRGWRANIDWFLRPDTVTKILEGKYDDRGPGGGVGRAGRVEAPPGKYDHVGTRISAAPPESGAGAAGAPAEQAP